MDGRTNLTKIEESLVSYLNSSFSPTDNLRRDCEDEAARISKERASLLLHAIPSPAELKTFLRVGEDMHGVLVAPLKEENIPNECRRLFADLSQCSNSGSHANVKSIAIGRVGVIPNPICNFRTGVITRRIPLPSGSNSWAILGSDKRFIDVSVPFSPCCDFTGDELFYLRQCEDILLGISRNLCMRSLLWVCQAVGYRGDAASVIRNRGADPRPYGDLRMRGRRLRPALHPLGGGTGFGGATENLAANVKHADLANLIVYRYFCQRQRRDGMNEGNGLVHKTYGGVWTPVIVFLDAHGQPQQTVAKYFWNSNGTKAYYPFTLWDETGLHGSHSYMVPLHPQPLLHLDLLAKDAAAPVVLTDSIDIAHLNQVSGPFVWTSFLCDEGQYDQVDWKPLAGRTVYLLVANHSGTSLAEAYLKADELRQHLADTLDDIDLRFAQVDVEYPPEGRRFDSLGELEDHWDSNPPAVRPGSASVMGEQLFEDRLRRAKESLRQPTHFYQDASPTVQQTVEKEKEGRTLIRPILTEGRVTMLHAPEGAGKSSLCLSMAAALIGQDHFVDEVFWTIPPEVRGKTVAVYFEAETDAGHQENSRRTFVWPYLASDPGKRAEQEKRLLRVDMRTAGRSLQDSDTKDWMLDIVRNHREQFDPGSPLLVVLDPYLAMVNYDEKDSSWGKVRTLFDALKNLGAAVLIVHHSNRTGGSLGNHNKERDVRCVIKMQYGGEEKASTLEVPRLVVIEKANGVTSNVDYTGFSLRRNPETGRWVVPEAEEEAGKTPGFKLRRFALLVKSMKASGHTNEDISKVLSIPRSTFYEMLKAAGLTGKDSQEAAD